MAGRLEQSVKDWTIRRKILSGFTVVLLLSGFMGWQALDGLQRLTEAVSKGQHSAEVMNQMFQDTRLLILVIMAITIILGDGKVACILDAVRILEQRLSA